MCFLIRLLKAGLLVLLFCSSVIGATNKAKNFKDGVFLSADFIEYSANKDLIEATGNIKVVFDEYTLNSDRLVYDIGNDLLWAEGDIKIHDLKGQIILGTSAVFTDQLKVGVVSDFILKFQDDIILAARLIERVDQNLIKLHNANYTPCKITCGRKPIWQISAKETRVDFAEQKMSYKHSFFEVYGVPVFYTPYFSHPNVNAKAKSGFLVPEIRKSSMRFPLYFRIKPNMDASIVPRFGKNYIILESEFRHRTETGLYNINASYGELPYSIKKNSEIIKNRRLPRYYVFTGGDFVRERHKYGFNLKKTSDKAYLKNYYNITDSYMMSKMYLNNVNYYNYISGEGLYFQGLGSRDSNDTDPLIFPKIRTRNVIDLNDAGNAYALVESDSLIYREQLGIQVGRTAITGSLVNNLLTSTGHLFSFTARNRADLYLIKDTSQDLYDEKLLGRNIPEAEISWRYPMARRLNNNSNATIEPIASVISGKKARADNKFASIDANKYEISDDNLFLANRYGGIDYHEFGTRLNYGLRSALFAGDNYFGLFLGQVLHKYNVKMDNEANIVGNVNVNILGQLELLYKFRKDRKFSPIKDEIAANFFIPKVRFGVNFIRFNNLRKYYEAESVVLTKNRLQQMNYDLGVQLTDNWSVGYDMRLDLSGKKPNLLYQAFKVVYSVDCIKVTAKMYDDYTFDSTRGIKKTSSYALSFRLKTLNM